MRIFPFMKCVARAVLHEGIEKFGKLAAEFIPFGGYAPEFVVGVAKQPIEEVRRAGTPPRPMIEAQAAASDAEARASAEAVVAEVAPRLPTPEKRQLTDYLDQLPLTLRTCLERPEDPTGTTVPFDWDPVVVPERRTRCAGRTRAKGMRRHEPSREGEGVDLTRNPRVALRSTRGYTRRL